MTTDTGMVDKLARAQFEAWNWAEDEHGQPLAYDDLSQDWRDAYVKVARAVLECLRTPTPEMVEGTTGVAEVDAVDWVAALSGTGIGSYQQIFEASLSAAIARALSPSKGEGE